MRKSIKSYSLTRNAQLSDVGKPTGVSRGFNVGEDHYIITHANKIYELNKCKLSEAINELSGKHGFLGRLVRYDERREIATVEKVKDPDKIREVLIHYRKRLDFEEDMANRGPDTSRAIRRF
mgnify:CR=1 FL=1